jgi:hypothetical protein
MKKNIWCFGDSWTMGMGSEVEPGSGKIDNEIKNSQEFRKKYENREYSYPSQLQKMLGENFKVHNLGFGGGSNYQIYRRIISIIHNLQDSGFKKGDIAIIGWTSIVREPLLFFKIGEEELVDGSDFSIKAIEKGHGDWYPRWCQQIEPNELKRAAEKSYEDFLLNRLNYDFMHEQVMNYICQIQVIFEYFGVDYLFFNAFENVLSKNCKPYEFIKKEKWVLPDYTLSDYLCDIEPNLDQTLPYSLWEDDKKKVERNNDGPHPNRIGYKFIADLIYKNLEEKKVLLNKKFI